MIESASTSAAKGVAQCQFRPQQCRMKVGVNANRLSSTRVASLATSGRFGTTKTSSPTRIMRKSAMCRSVRSPSMSWFSPSRSRSSHPLDPCSLMAPTDGAFCSAVGCDDLAICTSFGEDGTAFSDARTSGAVTARDSRTARAIAFRPRISESDKRQQHQHRKQPLPVVDVHVAPDPRRQEVRVSEIQEERDPYGRCDGEQLPVPERHIHEGPKCRLKRAGNAAGVRCPHRRKEWGRQRSRRSGTE